MTLATIRAGMAVALEGVEANVYAHLPGSPSLPCAVVGWPQEWELASYQGLPHQEYVIPVEVLVGFTHPESADDTLLTLLDDTIAALEHDPTFGFTCDSSSAASVVNVGVVDIDGDRRALAATVLVRVYG